MIEKICKITSIGKFEKHAARGDTTLKKFTVMFSGNGLGKTTLADIMRSLSTADSDIISGRKTLGSTKNAEAEIIANGQNYTYKNGAWNKTIENISIYDSMFVHENVYGGNVVDHAHKRNLFRVIVGKKGVTLAREIDELDSQIRSCNSDIKNSKQFLLGAFGKSADLKKIIESEVPQNIEDQITNKSKEVSAGEKKDELSKKTLLQTISLPDLPASFESLLSATLDDVSVAAEEVVERHISRHNGKVSERWISIGLDAESEADCPFCGQDTTNVSLIKAYRSVFGEKFKALKSEIETSRQNVKSMSLSDLERTSSSNSGLVVYWKKFVNAEDISLDLEEIEEAFTSFKDAATVLIKKKVENPLEQLSTSEEFRSSLTKYAEAKKKVSGYNEKVSIINAEISKVKSGGSTKDLQIVRDELQFLQALKKKGEADVNENIEGLNTSERKKGDLEKEKKEKKERLDKHTEEIFPVYQQKINEYLENFDAGFSIVKTQGSFTGGKPSSNYQLVIKNVAFDIGDSKSPKNIASFKNTLSSGDKSTLALAFFLAGLDLENEPDSRVVVFDDPFTSQDRFRRSYTTKLIVRECSRSSQVILLSHDEDFIKMVWEKANSSARKSLQIVRAGGSSSIIEWDIETDGASIPNRDQDTLVEYIRLGGTDKVSVVRAIRPWIESCIRRRYVGVFSGTDSLGHMIGKIKSSEDTHALAGLKPDVDELDDINDFSTEYQHGEDANKIRQSLDDGELKAYVKRALRLTGSI